MSVNPRLIVAALGGLAVLMLALGLKHYRAQYLEQVRAIEQLTQQQRDNNARWADKVRQWDAASKVEAERTQRVHDIELASARALADSYKRANRVQPQAHSVHPGRPAVAADLGASVPADTAPIGIVVSESDFDACTVANQYAFDAYEFVRTLPWTTSKTAAAPTTSRAAP